MPRVTCLCVSRADETRLGVSVNCWAQQTEPCDLVVVHQDPIVQLPTSAKHGGRLIAVQAGKDLTLGELRNVSLANCTTDYWAQWDDDDWFAPDRIEQQLKELTKSGADAVCLSKWQMFDETTGKLYSSRERRWEGSILCRKDALPDDPYKPLRSSEDSALMRLVPRLITLNNPGLYTYRFHGENVWTRDHFLRMCGEQVTDSSRIRSVKDNFSKFEMEKPKPKQKQPEATETVSTHQHIELRDMPSEMAKIGAKMLIGYAGDWLNKLKEKIDAK